MKKNLLVILLCMAVSATASAQLHYNSSIGIEGGALNGLSVRVFPNAGHPFRAFQFDLGYKFNVVPVWAYAINCNTGDYRAYDVIPNMYSHQLEMSFYWSHQAPIRQFTSGDLDWFAGGGFSLGTHFNTGAKLGFGLQFGMEYVFANVPFTIGLDLRPGAAADAVWSNYVKGEDGKMVDWGAVVILPEFDWSVGATFRFRIGELSGTAGAPRTKAAKTPKTVEPKKSAKSEPAAEVKQEPKAEPAKQEPKQEEPRTEQESNAYTF